MIDLDDDALREIGMTRDEFRLFRKRKRRNSIVLFVASVILLCASIGLLYPTSHFLGGATAVISLMVLLQCIGEFLGWS